VSDYENRTIFEHLVFLRLFYAPKKGNKFLTFVFYSFP
jgi:hypothetical protein